MTGKKLGKVLLVWLCVITLLMPFCSEVLAVVALDGSESEAVLETVAYRKGGAESTGLEASHYDVNSYAYVVSDTAVLKIIQSGDTEHVDTFYCVNAERSFSTTGSGYDYVKAADDFTKLSDEEVASWASSVGISTENFNSLVYILQNLYSKNLSTSYKNAYIDAMFATKIANGTATRDLVKEYLTDDDIEVIQQWAIWHFTNGTNNTNSFFRTTYSETNLPSVHVTKITGRNEETGAALTATQDLEGLRYAYAKDLYENILAAATAHSGSISNPTYPSIDRTYAASTVVDGDYYKVGPFKINGGDTVPSNFTYNIVPTGGTLPAGLKIYEDGVDVTASFTGVNFNKTYYLYLPIAGNTITSIKLTTSYTPDTGRKISLWEGENDEDELQPVVLLTNPTPVEEEISASINFKYDLALRKYIVSVNGEATNGRTPTPTAESLDRLAAGGTSLDYTGDKTPVSIKKGDRIVYEFRIYNEGQVDAKVREIVDYLPKELKIVSSSDSTTNGKFDWHLVEGWNKAEGFNKYTCTNIEYSTGRTNVKAFDKTTKAYDYAVVQLECEIVDDIDKGTVLTNIAEILDDNGDDVDSDTGSIEDHPTTINNDYEGDTDNPHQVPGTDTPFYRGEEDDDDFEKVVIYGEQFDLSLKKFISEVNGVAQNREPSYDTTPLKNNGIDANYTTDKTPITVEAGDIITYTLRVYNEGDIDGYAEQIIDYIPEGLGFLVNYKTNYNYKWDFSDVSDPEDLKSMKLTDVLNGTKNVKLSDFEDTEKLDDVEIYLGKSKVATTALASSKTSTVNKINAFDGSDKLDYKDVKISFIVVTTDALTLKNIAAITRESMPNPDESDTENPTVPVDTDRGPGKDSTPADDINPDTYTDGNEDDDDFDVVKTDKKNFDLALQKFVTGVNEEEVKGREPVVSITNGQIKYTHPKAEPVTAGNGDLIEYTIRVYNEGDIDGFAAEVEDDIPTGLVFVPDNDVNKEYDWKMYDKSGKETTDIKQAVKVKTTYLSKEASESNLLKAFDGSTLMYKDIKLVFRIDEKAVERTVTTEKRTLVNTAEISKNTDKDGNDIKDHDSTPGDGKLTDKDGNKYDDIDQEKVYVKYFDLRLQKTLNKAIVTTNGEKTEVNGNQLKIEIHRKNINSTSIQFVYTIKVTNEGEIEGYATEVTDYIPEGLSFDPASNPDWAKVSDKIIKTESLAKTLLKPGESAEVQVVLDWVRNSDNIGRFVNVAEISEDWNPYDSDDVDSTPNNLISTEDDQDEASAWVGIVTGLGDQPFIILPTVVLVILATGVILIKKYVL